MAISFVQQVAGTAVATAVASATVSPTAGNGVFVTVGYSASSSKSLASSNPVTDQSGNPLTYQLLASNWSSGTYGIILLFIPGIGSGITGIKVTLNAAPSSNQLIVDEFSGLSTSITAATGGTANQTSTPTTPGGCTTGNLGTTIGPMLLFGVGFTYAGTLSIGPGFTALSTVSGYSGQIFVPEYEVQNTTGNYATTWTVSATGQTMVVGAVVQAATGQFLRALVMSAGIFTQVPNGQYLDPTTLGSNTPSTNTFLRGDATWDLLPDDFNRVVNGQFRINQITSGSSSTPTTGTGYFIDGWGYAVSESSKLTYSGITSGGMSGAMSETQCKVLVATALASPAAGDYFELVTKIEGIDCVDLQWGTANAKSITVSFWVQASIAGTYGISFSNSAGNRCYMTGFIVTAANTPQLITLTIPGDTAGTWLTTTGVVGISIVISLGCGSTYIGTGGSWGATTYLQPTGAVNLVSTGSATMYVTDFLVQDGSSQTVYPYIPYSDDLYRCLRYYELVGKDEAQDLGRDGVNASAGSQVYYLYVPYKAIKCKTPTLGLSGTFTTSNCSVGVARPSTQGFSLTLTSTASGLISAFNSAGYVAVNAQL